MSADTQIYFAIGEIKELEFFVNENIELSTSYDFKYHVELRNDIAQKKIFFTITANYSINGSQDVFMKGKSSTVFLIKDFDRYVRTTDGVQGVDLPDPLWITLFGIAFTHARALLAKSSAGTRYSHMLMPLISPEAEFKKLFGQHLKPSSQ